MHCLSAVGEVSVLGLSMDVVLVVVDRPLHCGVMDSNILVVAG